MKLNTIPEIIKDIKNGCMVIIMDDPGRENEGDLIMAAEMVTPEHINFMVKHARGLICMPMSEEYCNRLKLPQMVDHNEARYQTQFTVSIEAATGVTTGISAYDRARTIQIAANPKSQATDLVRPGHIFPIKAATGGVLNRPGHTEATCDLCVLAGFNPCGILLEIMSDDGTMARAPELEKFAKQHQLKIGTISQLIEYRKASVNARDLGNI